MSSDMESHLKESSTNHENRDILTSRCLVNDTLAFIGKRWLMTVLYEILLGNNQFSSLKASLPGISDHILALRINDLYKRRLITKRKIGHTFPSRVAYQITPKASQLLELVNGLNEWSIKHG